MYYILIYNIYYICIYIFLTYKHFDLPGHLIIFKIKIVKTKKISFPRINTFFQNFRLNYLLYESLNIKRRYF